MTLPELNACTKEQFVEAVGWVCEHSPWVAERAWRKRPFTSFDDLSTRMIQEVQSASPNEQLTLLQAHPEVAWAQAMNEFQAQGHADPLYPLQATAAQWHLDALHTVATGRRVRVAIVDSGVITVAAVLIAANEAGSPVTLHAPGGVLEVVWQAGERATLIGDAVREFERVLA